MAALVFVLVAVQFGRIIHENVAMAQELSSVQGDVHTLEARRREQIRELRRLADPEGAVPEIHDRLRLVRPNEALIFVKPAPATPAP
jgi:cell division protein FtsB